MSWPKEFTHTLKDRTEMSMSIDQQCREQQSTADRIFMDFKYTKVGSKEQVQSIEAFQTSIVLWASFLLEAENRLCKSYTNQHVSV